MADPVIVIDYDPIWRETFERLRQDLEAALGDLPLTIEHIGSTAVPNLPSKPIVDIDIVVREESMPEAIRRLNAIGCVHQGDLGITGREAFTSIPGRSPHHLYLCRPNTPALRQHIVFRDFLRASPDAARAYGLAKQAAAILFRDDRSAYNEAKVPFIVEIMRRAAVTPTYTKV
jgi:GrpB-like predicted nucleotidyltransferase (UPF0157 family)